MRKLARSLVSVLFLPSTLAAQQWIDAVEAMVKANDLEINPGFGHSVAIDGDLAVIGDPHDVTSTGAAYIFERSAAGWQKVVELTGEQTHDDFGSAVALDGGTIVVAANREDFDGVVHVFERCGGWWTESAEIAGPGGGNWFGYGLAMDADRIVVGEPLEFVCDWYSGVAWVFDRDDNGTPSDPCDDSWVVDPSCPLVPSNCQHSAYFGISLDLRGDRIVVGAYEEDAPAGRSGAVYVFERSAGAWTETARLTADDGAQGDHFGARVAFAGETILVGAPDDNAPEVDRGSVYAFELQGGVWAQIQKFLASDGKEDDLFGESLAAHENVALVGTRYADGHDAPSEGSAYLFGRSGSVWIEERKLTTVRLETLDQFGVNVATDGASALVGAQYYDGVGSASVISLSQGQFQRFGFGDGSGLACPCGNEVPLGVEAGCRNGSSYGGMLSVEGSDSAAADAFRLVAWNLREDKPALLISGDHLANAGQGVVFGNGIRLIANPLVRQGIRTVDGASMASWGPGLGGSGGWSAGTTRYFQVWYRDPDWSCVSPFNFTNGVSITFQP